MDKEVENRFFFMENMIENRLVEHHKMISRLRAEIDILKADLGKSDLMDQFDAAISDRKPAGKR